MIGKISGTALSELDLAFKGIDSLDFSSMAGYQSAQASLARAFVTAVKSIQRQRRQSLARVNTSLRSAANRTYVAPRTQQQAAPRQATPSPPTTTTRPQPQCIPQDQAWNNCMNSCGQSAAAQVIATGIYDMQAVDRKCRRQCGHLICD